jgi:hypothetical protein
MPWRRSLHLAGLVAITLSFDQAEVLAHCFIGNRFFPATLIVDDPCVADELSLPTISSFPNSDVPSARQLDISGELSKRITENFGISVAGTWSRISPPGARSLTGFQNWETTFKYQFWRAPEYEFTMSAGLSIEWGGSGSPQVGADRFTTFTPTLFFGKGFGDLPETLRWARPFAITGQVGYAIPNVASIRSIDPDTGATSVDRNPRFLVYGATLQYSMPYLKSAVADLQLPDFFNRLVPIVEASFQTPVSNSFGTGIGTTGTINPGVIYVGDKYQIGVEAIIPINRASGSGIGVVAQLHLFLDDLFPRTLGRPLIGGALPPARSLSGL